MLKKCLAALVILGLIAGAAWADDPQYPYAKEQIGKLHLGLAAKTVQQLIPGKPVLGSDDLMMADAAYHQEWKYPAAGITLGMVAEKKGGPKSIERITLTSPSTLATSKGIRIGSTEAEVNAVYGRFRNAEDSEHFGGFIAGSVFGGVMFTFQQGKVSRIFIGAAAE